LTRLAAPVLVLVTLASPALAGEVDDLLARGEKAYLAGDEEAALEAFLEVTKKAPDRWEGFYYAGMILHVEGKADEAMQMYARAIEIKPDASEALNNLSVLLLEAGRLDEALETSLRAVDADPKNFEAAYTLGEVLEARGDLAQAIEAYLGSADLAPGDPDPFLAVAEISLALGKAEDAARALAQAFGRAPHDIGLGLLALEKLEEAGLGKEALALARKLMKRLAPKVSSHPKETFRVARVLRLLGDPGACLELLGSLPDDVRTSFSVRTEEGLAHLALGDCKKAAKAFDAALAIKPGDPAALVAKADALCCAGKWCKAKKAYKTFLEKAGPDDPHVPPVKQKLAQGKTACKKK
jgi:tetratricopeptide (TPR) repeat protein